MSAILTSSLSLTSGDLPSKKKHLGLDYGGRELAALDLGFNEQLEHLQESSLRTDDFGWNVQRRVLLLAFIVAHGAPPSTTACIAQSPPDAFQFFTFIYRVIRL
jgi:hypothetical protein